MLTAIDPVAKAKTNGHEESYRERRLRRLPHWDEIEIRLRHRWSPWRVVSWYKERWPSERPPSHMTLYRFLEGKPETWFVGKLTLQEIVTPGVTRLLVLEEHTSMCELQKARLMTFLQMERQQKEGGFGLPIPEIRANLELLNRMFNDNLRIQQELGLEPKVTPAGGREDGPDRGVNDEVRQLVARVLDLPAGQFLPAVVALIGPPPVKQPLVLESEVLASEKVEPPAGAEELLQGDDGQAEESDAD